ncbi:hypothetical protein [Bosea sp. NBC_00550]|uniref:hypothetical protein n=1 Tax=Bosea sp. NBC_00550 TaxID=2969621 RepID=UPI0022323A8B|nr:hypothetical protein [Bosea sp. NBC_00550]UZF93557.1 hypothetical protein NWE53_04985 [Bosea sp. NBC_00550]
MEDKLAYSFFTAVLASPLLIAAFSANLLVRGVGILGTAAVTLWIAAILFL